MNIATSFKRVMSPLTIRNLTIKNRVVRTAHATAFADGTISDELINYHLARAEGGVGLTILEGSWVDEASRNYARNIHSWTDDVIPGYQKLMEAIEPTGMRVFQQLWHGGGIYSGWQVVQKGPSALPGMFTGVPTRAFTREDIRFIVNAFAEGARRCDEGGLHGAELAGSHGYLAMQFLSPWSNQRTDEYGGSLENRVRFAREVLEECRKAVSDDFVMGMRVGPEVLDGGLTTPEIIEAMNMLKADGLLDFLNMSVGGYHSPESIVPALNNPAGVELELNRGVREATGLITFMSGRFRSLDEAEQVIAEGEADMVGMTRATIADPHLVKKTMEEGPDAVRPCIGCNQLCISNIFMGMPLQCTVNVQVGREGAFMGGVPKTGAPKKVLVVGGGPAGMEAARVAALAGHKVELHEAMPALGGTLKLVRPVPSLAGLADIIHWLEAQVYALGVDVRTSSYVETDEILASAPDVVLLATGATPRDDGWQLGAPAVKLPNLGARLLDTAELLSGNVTVEPGQMVVVEDDTGHFEAVGVAEFLLDKGAHVTFVTRFGDLAPQMATAWRARPALRRLNATGRFALHTHSYLADVNQRGDVVIGSFVEKQPIELTADHIACIGYNIPNDDIYDELTAAGFGGRVELLGDCASPRYLHAAIHDGFNIALSL